VVDKSVDAKKTLDDFFAHLNELGQWYTYYTSEVPKLLNVNPDIVRQMAQVEGFYQREEVQSGQVTAHAPIVRYFKLKFGVIRLVDDWEEKFLHFES
jgi:hypothetical protein